MLRERKRLLSSGRGNKPSDNERNGKQGRSRSSVNLGFARLDISGLRWGQCTDVRVVVILLQKANLGCSKKVMYV